MKVYKSFNKIIVTFIFLISGSSLIWLCLFFLAPRPFISAITTICLALLGAIGLEYQKPKIAKNLEERLFPGSRGSIFFFDNGKSFDFFESFLILNDKSIIVCTCYNLGQKAFNKLIKKETKLEILLHPNVLYVKIVNNDIILHSNNRETIIKDFDYIPQFEEKLLAVGYTRSNSTYSYKA